MIKGYKVSKHLIEDRADRVAKIATTVGFGEIEYIFPCTRKYEALTTTGVLIVISQDNTTIITMYLCGINKALALFKTKGEVIPKELKKVILNNIKKGLVKD